jgi:ribose 5-phosphate isomerase B
MKVFIGADHRGFHLKESLKRWLSSIGYDVRDVGAFSYNVADDFPDFAFAVADGVIGAANSRLRQGFGGQARPGLEHGARGIFVCGSGVGGMIAANKVKGIYCCLGMNKDVVEHSRRHDDCNVLSLSADHTNAADAKVMIETFFNTPFEPQERFLRRIRKIQARER